MADVPVLNLFGQRHSTTTADADAARLEVSAPKRVRGGLFYQARFRVDAVRELGNATLGSEAQELGLGSGDDRARKLVAWIPGAR